MRVSEPHKGEATISPNYTDGLLNPNLSWEETDQYDFGLDLDFFIIVWVSHSITITVTRTKCYP